MPNNELTNEALRTAASKVRNALLETLPPPSECNHAFSEPFNEKMALLIRTDRRRTSTSRFLRRVAIVFLVLLLGVSSFLAVNSEARATVMRWIREAFDNVIVYHFQGAPEKLIPHYTLTWVPEGYEEIERIETDRSLQILYMNEETEDLFAFEVSLVHEGKESYIIMSSNQYKHENLTVKGCHAEYFQEALPGEPDILMWFNSEETLVFYLHGFFDKTIMLHIAENIKLSIPTNYIEKK